MSLRDRLRRRTSQADLEAPPGDAGPGAGLAVAGAEGAAPRDDDGPLVTRSRADLAVRPAAPAAGAMYGLGERAGPEPALTAVDQLKVDLHHRLVERLDLAALERITDEAELTAQIRDAVVEFLRGEQTPLSAAERDEIVEQIVWEVTGLGPLEPLFRDPSISDILVNGPRDVYVERGGRLSRVNTSFRNDAHLLTVIDRIVSRVGRRVDESSPMVDARLPDGSRVNAIIPPLALDGPVVSIRRFGTDLDMDQLIATGALTRPMAVLLAGCVHARLNILISGGTGSGKTTMLNALSSFIPESERLITIEDAAELKLRQEHVVRLETRPPNVEGHGEVVARDLVRNALRMRPNRIIIGEVRSVEVVDMLQAMNTGHEGSLATIHANTPRDALARLEAMMMMAGVSMPLRALREQIAATIDVIVQVARLTDGSRRVVSITEVAGMEGDVITTSEIYEFRRRGVANGRVVGTFTPTGIRPLSLERLEVAGVRLPPGMFDEDAVVEVETPEAPDGDDRGGADPAGRWGAVADGIGRGGDAMGRAQRAALEAASQQLRQLQALLDDERRTTARLRDELRARAATAAAADPGDDGARERAEGRLRAVALSLLAFVESVDELVARAERAGDDGLRAEARLLATRAEALLRAAGLAEVEAAGRTPNESEHEVVGGAGRRIVRVVQRGFRYDGRVVRRAQVEVGG